MYRYFISYSTARGTGNTEVNLPRKIEDIADVRSVATVIEQKNSMAAGSVVVTNFQLFGDPN